MLVDLAAYWHPPTLVSSRTRPGNAAALGRLAGPSNTSTIRAGTMRMLLECTVTSHGAGSMESTKAPSGSGIRDIQKADLRRTAGKIFVIVCRIHILRAFTILYAVTRLCKIS